jgi:hypothetical protein
MGVMTIPAHPFLHRKMLLPDGERLFQLSVTAVTEFGTVVFENQLLGKSMSLMA